MVQKTYFILQILLQLESYHQIQVSVKLTGPHLVDSVTILLGINSLYSYPCRQIRENVFNQNWLLYEPDLLDTQTHNDYLQK